MEKAAEITISYKPHKRGQPMPRVANSRDAFNAIYPHFDHQTIHIQEQFLVAYLDQSNQIKGVYSGFRGGITCTVADVSRVSITALPLMFCMFVTVVVVVKIRASMVSDTSGASVNTRLLPVTE